MSHQFKPGDLALILRAHNPSAVGNCCELIQYAGRYITDGSDPGYAIWDSKGLPTWLVADSDGLGYVFQRDLMPLKGDGQPAQVRQAEGVQ